MENEIDWSEYSKIYPNIHKLNSYKKLISLVVRLSSEAFKNDPKKILDLGCGTGVLAKELSLKFPNSNIKAVDGSSGMIEAAKKRNSTSKIDYIYRDISEPDLYEACFDLIVMNNVLYTISDKENILINIKRALKNNGKFILSDCRAVEESSYLNLIKSEIVDIKHAFYLLLNSLNLIKVLGFNKKIDKSFVRLTKKGMESLLNKMGFRILKEMDAYEGQNVIFILSK